MSAKPKTVKGSRGSCGAMFEFSIVYLHLHSTLFIYILCFALGNCSADILSDLYSRTVWLIKQMAMLFSGCGMDAEAGSVAILLFSSLVFFHSPNSYLPWIYCFGPSLLLRYCLEHFLLIFCVGDNFFFWTQLWRIGCNLVREGFVLPRN